MNEFDFGKHLREQLNTHPSSVNTDALWSAVEARLPRKRKRRGFLFFFSGLLGALLLLAIHSWTKEEHRQEFDSVYEQKDAVVQLREGTDLSDCDAEQSILPPRTEPKEHTTQVADRLPSLTTTSFHESPNALGELSQLPGASDLSFVYILEPLAALQPSLLWNSNPPQLQVASISDEPEETLQPLQKSGFFLRQDLGAGLVQRQLQSHVSTSESYALARNRTEQPLESVQGQLLLGYQFQSGYYLLSGLSITRINERFQMERNREEIETVPVLVEVFINQYGDSLFTYGSANLIHVHHEEYTHYNRYAMFEIPFIAGYAWQFRRWSLGLEAGALLNVSLKARGSMLNEADIVVRMEDSGVFKPRVSWSYLGQARLGYALSERLEWSVSPGAQLRPGSLLSSSQLEQRYRLLYLQTGLSYRFGKH